MDQTFLATFEDGVLKPHEPLRLLPHSQVRVTVELVEDATSQQQQQPDSASTQDAWKNAEQLWKASKLDSAGNRLTREQLHERR